MNMCDINKVVDFYHRSMGLMKKLAAIIGLALISVSIVNVELGALMSLDPPQKLVLAKLADPGCNEDDIQTDLDSGDVNACVTAPGVWDAPDLLLLVEGCIMFFASFMRWPRKGRWAVRVRKMAVVTGVILCCVALADRFGQLPGTSSDELASLLPFPAPGIAVQIGLFAIGIFLIRGPKYKVQHDKERERKNQQNYSIQELDFAYKRGGNLGSLSKPGKIKGAAKYKTVGDLWGHQGLSVYEDAFEGGMRDNFGASLGRTCHLCNGEGCPGCGNTGAYS